jgi:hypothetical protein
MISRVEAAAQSVFNPDSPPSLCQIGETTIAKPINLRPKSKPPDFDSAYKIQEPENRVFPT